MIRYTLRCDAGHGFDSWFQNGTAFESLLTAGQISCPICGATKVTKDLMAPAVRPARAAVSATKGPLSDPGTEIEAALAELRLQVEANSEYVGMNFVTEARRMHSGDAPERAIYGEAKPDEAKRLIEDGVPVAPLPFLPGRKVN